ncbi:Guanine nucleotide-binding protein, beta subunit [Parasponia andersonii]|uniref:Guanine nucleotide-binding protein, beta subunit n=1 Tax=Parasponia andersonii TaxID=3476 RepID=A0A2P5AQ76_PARAD|nr:Guanine nucleotide-binding protein, beta subunit [Parasponia andersonii]
MVNILKGQSGGLKGEHLKHTSINGVDIYTITSQQRSIPSWISDKNRKVPRRVKQKDQDKVSLLQDLWFETSTSKIKATPDGEYLIASGIYPPQVKVYELSQLSMKFERHLDSEIIDFQGRFLSSLTTQSPALNVVSRSKIHGLVACGGDDGSVECFDMRMRSSIGRINAVSPASGAYEDVTALEFDGDADFHMAVGSSAGKV